MSRSSRVVYVTGAPGVGKTSVIKRLLALNSDLAVFEYGRQMANYLSAIKSGATINQECLRGGTDTLVSSEDIAAVNAAMIEWVALNREEKVVLIDTHQVTLEKHGFRLVPFNDLELRTLGITDILVLVAPEEVVVARIGARNEGRRIPSLFQARMHAEAQLNVAISYAVQIGVDVRIIETGSNIEQVVANVKAALHI